MGVEVGKLVPLNLKKDQLLLPKSLNPADLPEIGNWSYI
jgi:hypothetical protein